LPGVEGVIRMGYVVAAIGAAIPAFVAGLISFRIKTTWCTVCGRSVGRMCANCRDQRPAVRALAGRSPADLGTSRSAADCAGARTP
jgi:hypothetical protein